LSRIARDSQASIAKKEQSLVRQFGLVSQTTFVVSQPTLDSSLFAASDARERRPAVGLA
jgi:hypothetical protein